MMQDDRFFDQTLALIERGEAKMALPLLAGKLYNAIADPLGWPETRARLHRHPLHAVLMEDPFSAYSARRPRGYPGDAGLIDIIYDRSAGVHAPVSERGHALFDVTVRFQAPEAVRQRRDHAARVLSAAWQSGKRILVLACGHFREGDALIGNDLGNVVLVDQDAVSLEVVHRNHGQSAQIHEANVLRFLRHSAMRGDSFDLVYTLGLTDYFDARALNLLCHLVREVMAPGGSFLLANFLPGHLGTGWMDAVMDWQLIYREERELEEQAREVGLIPRTWRDPTDSIVWCQMDTPE